MVKDYIEKVFYCLQDNEYNVIILKGDQILKGNINISFPEDEIKFSKQNMVIGVFDEKGKLVDSFETTFEGPFKLAL